MAVYAISDSAEALPCHLVIRLPNSGAEVGAVDVGTTSLDILAVAAEH